MTWIVSGEKNGKIKLLSKKGIDGLLPKGSYLTVEIKDRNSKFILRVDNSNQVQPFSPSPLIVDMDLSPLSQDQACKNEITAYRVKDITHRDDGLIDYIPPLSIARRSTQEEIDLAMGMEGKEGPIVFVATVHSGQNQILKEENGKYITAKLPSDMFFHQMLICGRTGSGKTVATKYLAQYFAEEMEGAVLAVNVKDTDFLHLNKPSVVKNEEIFKEWESIGMEAHGIENFVIYYPANQEINFATTEVDRDYTKRITLNVREIEPESLIGLLHGISDIAAQNLPDIFRYWKENRMTDSDNFSDFIKYFSRGIDDKRHFYTLNSKGDESEITLHRGTFDNIQRNLSSASEFFDNEDAETINEDDILQGGKVSVINVTGDKGPQFGAILLRDLLHRIVVAKSNKLYDVPVLIIIDEVHQFYNTDASREALGDLDTICRTGRSQKIGVIFSSQNPSDIPRGLSSVINTKIFFKSDSTALKNVGISIQADEVETLKKGFAIANVHEMSQLKILKFPLAYAGVFEED